MKRILCVPLDPVHDVGIKLIRNALSARGHMTELLSPDLPMEEIVRHAAAGKYECILVSRTLGYGVAELLGRFIDLLDAAGVREHTRVILGGKPITPELAAELGFDRGFGEHTSLDEVLSFIEGEDVRSEGRASERRKPDIYGSHSYTFHDQEIRALLDAIAEKTLAWAARKTSPALTRAKIREEILVTDDRSRREALNRQYDAHCDPTISAARGKGAMPAGVRAVRTEELSAFRKLLADQAPVHPTRIQHAPGHPLLFKFLGSGCPLMDMLHGRICERYGIDGFLIINPSWEARYEGLLTGCLTHENDGTITSGDNLRLMREMLHPATLLTVRAHRGLNTTETVVLAGEAGADLTKINLVYGSLGAGTDPERLAVDGLEAMRIAARYGMGFDIPGNDELSGVPAWKTLAGILVNVALGLRVGARPIPKPLLCYGPHIVLNGQMQQNFVDYNIAKVRALRALVDAPVWPGEPIAFMTQTEERVQSASATAFHAALAASAGVDAITIASTDEAYSRGPITIASRIDSIRAVAEANRFVGDAGFTPTAAADRFTDELLAGIRSTLKAVATRDHLPDAIMAGILGSEEDGAYPGKFGKGTVSEIG